MNCRNLMEIRQLNGLKLVAGREGIHRTIRWLYFADVLECLKLSQSPDAFINGGELVVITNENTFADAEKIERLIRIFNQKNIAGIIFNIGMATAEYCNLADELKLPLFELPWEIRTIDLSQIICTKLIEEKNAENTLENILMKLLYETQIEQGERYSALEYQIDLEQSCQIMVLDIEHFKRYLDFYGIQDERAIARIKKKFHQTVNDSFTYHLNRNVMSMIQGDSIIVLFQSRDVEKRQLELICQEIGNIMNQQYPNLKIWAGVGNSCQNIEKIKKSYNQAMQACKIAPILEKNSGIQFFDNLGIYELIFQIENKEELKRFFHKVFGPIEEYDKQNHSELLETLRVYLENNCNAKAAAEKLYIHRNTMQYRIEKISLLLDAPVNHVMANAKYVIAFAIQKYIENDSEL